MNNRTKAFIKLLLFLEQELNPSKKRKMLRDFPYQIELEKILTYIFTRSTLRKSEIFSPKLRNFSKKFKESKLRFDLFLEFLSYFRLVKTIGTKEIEIYITLLRDTTKKESHAMYKIFKGDIQGLYPKLVSKLFPQFEERDTEFAPVIKYSPEVDIIFPVWAEPFPDSKVKLFISPEKTDQIFEGKPFKIPGINVIEKSFKKLNGTVEIDFCCLGKRVVATDLIMGGKLKPLFRRREFLEKYQLSIIPHKEIKNYLGLYSLCMESNNYLLRDPLSFPKTFGFVLSEVNTEIVNLKKVLAGKGDLKEKCISMIVTSQKGEERIIYEMAPFLRKMLWKKQKSLNKYYGELLIRKDNPQINRLVSIRRKY